jgi:hypothetical protein
VPFIEGYAIDEEIEEAARRLVRPYVAISPSQLELHLGRTLPSRSVSTVLSATDPRVDV